MTEIIKIKCNGPGKHLNEVNLRKLLREDIVLKKHQPNENWSASIHIQVKYIKKCKKCVEEEIIITHEMIEKVLKQLS